MSSRGAERFTIDTADAFAELLFDETSTHAELVSVQAPANVWWDVLDRYPHCAAWVAANRQLPDDIAEHLAGHPDLQVRAALASGGGRSEPLMLQLAHDKSEMIRLRVVCNRTASRNVLTALAVDPCQVVAAHAQARLQHDIAGMSLPANYLDDVEVMQLLLH